MSLFKLIGKDIDAIFERDPAARNILEVFWPIPVFMQSCGTEYLIYCGK